MKSDLLEQLMYGENHKPFNSPKKENQIQDIDGDYSFEEKENLSKPEINTNKVNDSIPNEPISIPLNSLGDGLYYEEI